MKPFKTISEQIEIMRSRDLIVEDEIDVGNYLLSNNYYNIINGYSKFFPRNGEKYTNRTTFNEVKQLYLFDLELKQGMFKAILLAESHIKSIFAYHFAKNFRSIPYPYLNTACYDDGKTLSVVSTISKLSGIINHHKTIRSSSICHYINRHGEVPIWVLVNYLDFGDLRHMLDASKTTIQNEVARDLGGFISQNLPEPCSLTPEFMLSYMANINDVRNVCAHNNRLLGFVCRRDNKYWDKLHDRYGISSADERRSVYSVFISLQLFLSSTEYAMLHNLIRKRMNYLKNHLRSISIGDIVKTLGFPDSWPCDVPKLEQKQGANV